MTKDNTLGLSGTVSDAGGVSSVQIYDGATLLGPALLTDNYAAGYAFNESPAPRRPIQRATVSRARS